MAKVLLERNAILLVVITSTLFFASGSGIFSSNDGSHLALAKALYHNHSFVIDSFSYLTGGIDYAEFGGHIYSDRAPGMAFAILPFYAVSDIMSNFVSLPVYFRGWEIGEPTLFFSLFLSHLAGGLCVALVYLTAKKLGAGEKPSIIAALTAGFGTVLWKYSVRLYSHSLSAALFMLALYLAVGFEGFKKNRLQGYLLFFSLGFLPLLEYPNALLSAVFIIYLFASKKVKLSVDKTHVIAALCFLIPVLVIPSYNLVNFGNPFTPAYVYSPHHAWVADFSESAPLFEGVVGLLFSNEWGGSKTGADGGLFLLTPALFLALVGFYSLYKTNKNETLLIAGLFLAHLLFYGRFKTWWGGSDFDTRYLLTVTPAIVLGLAFWLEDFVKKVKDNFAKTFLLGITCVTIVFSFVNVAQDVAYGQGVRFRFFEFPSIHPSEIFATLSAVFPNLNYVPVYLGFIAVGYALTSIVMKRTPGYDREKIFDIDTDKAVLSVLVVGVLLILIFSGAPKAGFVLKNFRYSDNIMEDFRGQPPFSVKGDVLYVKGVVEVSGAAPVILDVSATDCIRRFYVNERNIEVTPEGMCTPCLHCNGIKFDLTQLIKSGNFRMGGQNQIAFEVVGLGDTTELRFN